MAIVDNLKGGQASFLSPTSLSVGNSSFGHVRFMCDTAHAHINLILSVLFAILACGVNAAEDHGGIRASSSHSKKSSHEGNKFIIVHVQNIQRTCVFTPLLVTSKLEMN